MVRPPKLLGLDRRVTPVNAGFAAFLEGMTGKRRPTRLEPLVREHPRERTENVVDPEQLEAFARSLDPSLMPVPFEDDPSMTREWTRFWEARNRSCGAFFWRFVEETSVQQSRARVPRKSLELSALQGQLAEARLQKDLEGMKPLMGRRGVDLIDLTFALWTSHADGWFELAVAPSAIAAARELLGRDRAGF